MPAPDGERVRMKLRAGTGDGVLLRARGRGAPKNGDSGKRGDLLARVHISVPRKLSRAQKEALEKFAALDGDDPRAELFARAAEASMMDETPKYAISVAAEFVGMHPQTLRLYEARRLVVPRRSAGGRRLYSDADLARLESVKALTTALGLNHSGVEHVLALEQTLTRLQDARRRARARARGAPARLLARGRRARPQRAPRGRASGSRPRRRSHRVTDFTSSHKDTHMATNDQFTIRAREALAAAAELARAHGNPEITPEHLLLALTAEPDATASVLLRGAGADRDAVRAHAEAALAKLPTASGATTTQQPSLAFRETLDRARKEATRARRPVRRRRAPAARARRPARPRRRGSRARCSRPRRSCAARSAPTTRTPRSATTRSRASAAT